MSIDRNERCAKSLTVDELRGVVYDAFDLTLLLKVTNSNASQTSVDFETLDEDALADEFEG